MRKTNNNLPPKQADVIERKEVEKPQQSSASDVHHVISSHQQIFGNEMVSLALQQTENNHFHSMIEDDIQMNLAGIGVGPSVGPDASNQDMLSLMRRVSSGNASDSTDAQAQVDKVLRGPGVPLPEAVRQKLESVFAKDLSAVRIHSDGSAAQAAMSVNAKAFAVGNDIVFGLAAGVWTSDIGRALKMSEKLKAGTVWVNTYRAVSFMAPFGGFKRSGQGRESGQESIKEFMQVKSVWIAQKASAANPFIMQ